ncbi:uncharacterized protein G6M90_00g108650 [Metarhizium brunneum]|uniref:Uncharacterized protein n=1 Tax=Metarhizium brunneum TaxID=500148 RepID=A0A7D5ZAP4_9HYPO|nr:hypothetical protein G6M90_00g108650 [Metarhizium brunneum]
MAKDQDSGHDGKAEDFPSICSLRSKTFKKPIIARCGHYFDEPRALGRYKTDPGYAESLVGKNLPSNWLVQVSLSVGWHSAT